MFTKAVGIGFIVLSALRLTPIINATGKWLLYVSIAALFLILSDLLEFIIEGIVEKKGIKLNKSLKVLRLIFLAGAVIAIIVLPNLKINIPVKEVNALSDAITLVSLGIAITLIGFKKERVQISLFNKTNTIRNEVREFINSIEGQSIVDERISKLSLQDTQLIRELNEDSK
ncbi:hypothetical protein M3650_04370 [Paenibacillus sp. MER TA 81-3]|uniref:hypothetical protein n=1 Tax=Paenibacillus sp. MER TA 81-3 TaxID=2939573 RepID=UPI00203AFE00|nr:hypothetical protein [Paenibacillus sp. MER TA 81-3]MCM3337887.1 hypothetical protein [Paenibacillus sp. MER TA 81-3]